MKTDAFFVNHLLMRLLLLAICTNCFFYRKFMTLGDPDYSTLFAPLTNPPPMLLKSLIECAAYAGHTLSLSTGAYRASAFQYIGGNCTLGRTPLFDDQVVAKPTVTDGSDGVHAIVGMKPVAAVTCADMLAFFLFNEQLTYPFLLIPGLKNLTIYNLPLGPPPWSFPIVSPVQTLEGQFAQLNTSILYQHDKRTYTNITVMLWYNSGQPTPIGQQPLFGIYAAGSASNNYMALFGGGSGGAMELRLVNNDPVFNHYQSVTISGVVPTGTWTYVGYTYNINGTCALYVDGRAKKTGMFTNGGSISVIDTMEIGFDNVTSLNGYIASVEVYERSMTQAEVQSAMQMSTTARTLVV